ncbi:MAG: BrnT family toxin [Pyrinomonadaceae bacterium]|jgi:hypothetical protein|nr:BrnT family toxin [Pyrinomonadaceae bacterium]
MLFNWNPKKAKSNLKKHNVSFEEATTVFASPLADTFDDPDHSVEEQRFIIIGYSKNDRLLFVSHTDDGEKIRIISAREVTQNERQQYEEGF